LGNLTRPDVSPPRAQDALTELTVGGTVSRIVEGERRFDLVVRLPQASLDPATIGDIPIDTPAGSVPLHWLGDVESGNGPSQILRENLRRRIAVSAYAGAGRFDQAVQAARASLADLPLPPGYELYLEGEFQAQAAASRRIGGLALLSLLLMLAVLYARYRSLRFSLIILGNVPLAMIGGIAALALTHTPLSVASLVGFVALAGIAARNGILKLSRYLQLAREGEPFNFVGGCLPQQHGVGAEIDGVPKRPVRQAEAEVGRRSAFRLHLRDEGPEPGQMRFRRSADLARKRPARLRPAEAERHILTDTRPLREGKTFRSAPEKCQTVGSGVTSITGSLASTARWSRAMSR